MRTPLRELKLQPEALADSGKGPMFSSLTPYLRRLDLKERRNSSSPVNFVNAENSSPVDFVNTENTSPVDFDNTENNFLSEQFSHPSEYIEACQRESDLTPESSSPFNTLEKAVEAMDDFVAEPIDDGIVKTMVLLPFSLGQQQDLMLQAHLDTTAERNKSSLKESLGLEDLVEKEAAPCVEDSLPETVAIRPEQPISQDPPLRDSNTEAAPAGSVPSENVLDFTVACLSPSTVLTKDFSVDHVDPGEETAENRVIQEVEKSFLALPEEAGLGDQALAVNAEDVSSLYLSSSLVEMGPQEAPGPTAEDASRIPDLESETWMSPLAWLEKGVNTSVMLQSLRQSLPFSKSVLQDAAVGNTPHSTYSVGTSFTPPVPLEVGTKDSTSETERLLLGCRPPDLAALSRHDLEENLLNALVLLEVLSHQLQAWKSQLTVPSRQAQDSSTQTDSSAAVVTKTPKHLQDSKEIRQALLQARNVIVRIA